MLSRYWVQCMSIPDYIHEAIVEDTQALIWAKEADFDAEEMGTRTAFSPLYNTEPGE
jgi:hypothetical protein